MLRHCYSVISSPLPSAMQATAMIAFLSVAFPLASSTFSKTINNAKAPILAWMRNNQREAFAVNHALIEGSGLSLYDFVGLTYDRAELDSHLVKSRHASDDLIYRGRQPVIVQEESKFGLLDTFNCPMVGSDGNVIATLHLAVPLDFPDTGYKLDTSSQGVVIQTR